MPDIRQLWSETIRDYRKPNISKDRYELMLYRLCKAQALLHIPRRYGRALDSRAQEDVTENACSKFLERCRQKNPMTTDPLVYFFTLCFLEAHSAMGRAVILDKNKQSLQEKALEKIGHLQAQEKSVESVLAQLEAVGDLLRLGGSLVGEQRFAFRILRLELVRLCAAQATKWARLLPTPQSSNAPLSIHDLSWMIAEKAFSTRDRLESIRVALSHWSMENEFSLFQPIQHLESDLERLDQKLSSFLPLPFLALLGARQEIVSVIPLPGYLQPRTEEPQDGSFIYRRNTLSEEMLADFLCEGDHDALVKGLVEESDEVRELLQEFLEEARWAQVPRSIAARHLEYSLMQAGRPEDALPIVLPRTPAAAALEAPLFSQEKQREVSLGKLPEHDAHLAFLSEVDSPVLRVYPGKQGLSSVTFGEQQHPRKTFQIWEVALGRWPDETEPIKIVLQFQDGSLVEETFRFTDPFETLSTARDV